MKKILIACLIVVSLASCSKSSTPAPPQTVKVETNLAVSGKPYTLIITETISGTTSRVLDTTVTGQFNYSYTAAANVANEVEVESDDTLAQ